MRQFIQLFDLSQENSNHLKIEKFQFISGFEVICLIQVNFDVFTSVKNDKISCF